MSQASSALVQTEQESSQDNITAALLRLYNSWFLAQDYLGHGLAEMARQI
jgi:hypothetical protein